MSESYTFDWLDYRVAVEHLATELQPIESKHRLQSHELAQSAKILSQLMENYNGIVSFFNLPRQAVLFLCLSKAITTWFLLLIPAFSR